MADASKVKTQKEDVWIHTTCGMCEGFCGMLVHRVDGVVREITGDPDCPNSMGKLCSRGIAAIMSLYDPYRVKTPLRRTNPEKGLGVDPGWEPISWDEALNILVEKLTKVRKEDPRKLVISTFDTYGLANEIAAFCIAFGTANVWVVYFCGEYLHCAMYLMNSTFHCEFDVDYCNRLLLFGNQVGFGVGLNPNISAQKVAEARKRGMKVVAIDPVCGYAGSKADEWIPIRPGTDCALALSMIHVLLNELGIYDREFLKKHTNGPYLVKPDGFYMKDENGKPLLWDAAEGKAKPYDADFKDYALEGSYSVDGVECKTAFQLLKEHVSKYTPEMASEITTIPPATIRHLAEDWGKDARIGSTITVDGVELPYRPVAANIYRGAGSHKHGIASALSILLLNLVVGAYYVPGGHRGINAVGPDWSWAPGEVENTGLMLPAEIWGHASTLSLQHDYYNWNIKPSDKLTLKELYPVAGEFAPNVLLTTNDPEKYKIPYKPEVLLICRRNLLRGGFDWEATISALNKYKFIATFSQHLDEMTEFADLVLPTTIDLEELRPLPSSFWWSETGTTGYWYWGLMQPVAPPEGEARDWRDVLTEVADRMGFLGDIYKLFNLQYKFEGYNKLDPSRKYTREEIADRRFKTQFGEDKGLDFFKEKGYISRKRTVDEQFPLPWIKARFPLYFENYLGAGQEVKRVTDSMGLEDWDVSDYDALPFWKACDSYDSSKDRFDLKAVTFRIPWHSQTFTDQNPWLCELAEFNPYAQKILINTETAKRKGIKDGDNICMESVVGQVIGKAKVTECIHPEVVASCNSFGSLVKGKPVAYGKGVCHHKLLPSSFDPCSGGPDQCVGVKVYKV